MKTLLLNTRNEFFKLISKKKYFIILIISVLICIGRLGSSILISALSYGSITLKSNMILEMMPFCAEIVVPLLVFMAVTDLFSSEVQEDTMKADLLRPVSRFKVLTSKAIASFLIGALCFAVFFITCLILQLISKTPFDALSSFAAYVIDLIPIFALVFLAIVINLISKSPSLAMLLCIGIYALFKYLNYFVSPLGQLIFTAYAQWHKLWLGQLLPFNAMISKIGVLLGSILILYTVSYIIFDKKDF